MNTHMLFFILIFMSSVKSFSQKDSTGYIDSLGKKQLIWLEVDSSSSFMFYYNYKDGLLDGVTTKISFDRKYIYLLTYKNNQLDGVSHYYINRKISKIFEYENNELKHEIVFGANGEIWLENRYENGLAHGLCLVYRGGKPYIQREYKNGKKNGAEIIYSRRNKVNYYIDDILQVK